MSVYLTRRNNVPIGSVHRVASLRAALHGCSRVIMQVLAVTSTHCNRRPTLTIVEFSMHPTPRRFRRPIQRHTAEYITARLNLISNAPFKYHCVDTDSRNPLPFPSLQSYASARSLLLFFSLFLHSRLYSPSLHWVYNARLQLVSRNTNLTLRRGRHRL